MFAWIRKLWHGIVHFWDTPEKTAEDEKTETIDGVTYDVLGTVYVQERNGVSYTRTYRPGSGLSQAQQYQQFLEEAQAHAQADMERTHADMEHMSETQRQFEQEHQTGSDMAGMGDMGMGGGF